MPRRPMTPEDIRAIVVVEELDVSADGRTAVIVRRSIKGNRYLGHLFAIDLGSGRAIPTPRRLTRGVVRDTKPRVCPDGRTIAFIRTDPADDESVAAIMKDHIVPHYQLLFESFEKAQSVQQNGRETQLDRLQGPHKTPATVK